MSIRVFALGLKHGFADYRREQHEAKIVEREKDHVTRDVEQHDHQLAVDIRRAGREDQKKDLLVLGGFILLSAAALAGFRKLFPEER